MPAAMVRVLALSTALMVFAAVSGCGYKTPLELPKKAQPAKPSP